MVLWVAVSLETDFFGPVVPGPQWVDWPVARWQGGRQDSRKLLCGLEGPSGPLQLDCRWTLASSVPRHSSSNGPLGSSRGGCWMSV